MKSSAPQATAIRHVLFEDLGLIGPILAGRGFEVTYLDAGVDELGTSPADAELLVVLGGPIGVGDADRYPFLGQEIDLISRRAEAGLPTLGVCLGAQLMAAALGAGVGPTGRTEIGFSELTLTQDGRESVLAPLEGVPVFHWHGDEFEIPAGADRLASTGGFPNQAFSLGSQNLALQFHIEADLRFIERWLIGHSGELATAGIDPQALRDGAARHGCQLADAAREVIESWLDGI
ncbi:MAG: glutamine amidotransferase [Solirubrobacterales bacterium]|nr:glutamine amidotransferase [Solirubrobacterales bacterium]HRV60183.1 glutamine amidotransferase [Solirubrobacterales bacterium]